ncbi:hypothetical protein [Candidatus Nardonella dryophthoridicola]|uniref:NAD-dependent DNA ligase adenylation domain-containing protein n=1 Tax=endosymbiont of Metamasius hemipterus TaxID=204627 RepID=A0ABT0TX58_9GAMM|nr:hypothetical protein [endosymbiont of Metamasius hemipterus]
MEYKKKYPFLIKENILKNIFNNKKIYKIKHIIPMLSINSVYNINNIIKYNNKINKLLNINNIKYCCEYKIDGLAINLLYINGILYKASTRGDGYYGENVINNIKYINGIKKYLLFFKNIKK